VDVEDAGVGMDGQEEKRGQSKFPY